MPILGHGIEKKAFRAWLEERYYQSVGKPLDACACPVAHWLNDTQGGEWAVDVGICWQRDEDQWTARHEERWIGSFVLLLDGYCLNGLVADEVTGGEVLGILDAIGV
jgi:hypothetical protein